MRYGRRAAIYYPMELAKLLPFGDWLKQEIARAMDSDDKPSRDVYEASKLLEIVAIGYRAMPAECICEFGRPNMRK